MDPAQPSYGRVAIYYEAIASVYSGGAIAAAKASQVDSLRRGERVLYAGVGCGEDALLAARAGVEVVGLDVSDRMLRRFDARLSREGLSAELHADSVFDHAHADGYDTICANFFLNLFPPELMSKAVAQLASLLRPAGRLFVADFAPPTGSRVGQFLARAYYRPVNVAAWSLRLCSLHPIYDYAGPTAEAGLEVVSRERFRILGRGPAWFESLAAQKIS